MNKFVKENLVLVIGLTLPLFLILLFFVATVIPKSMTPPPQYPLLLTSVQYDYQHAPDYLLEFTVKDQHLMVKAKSNTEKNTNYNVKKLMIYDAKTETTREISLDINQVGALAADKAIVLEETKDMLIEASNVSPDGYVFEVPGYSGSGLMGGLFGSGYRSGYRLKKGAVAYKISNAQPYYYGPMQFVGWVKQPSALSSAGAH